MVKPDIEFLGDGNADIFYRGRIFRSRKTGLSSWTLTFRSFANQSMSCLFCQSDPAVHVERYFASSDRAG